MGGIASSLLVSMDSSCLPRRLGVRIKWDHLCKSFHRETDTPWFQLGWSNSFPRALRTHIIQEILLVLDHLTHPRGFGQLILCSDVGGRSPTLFAVDAAKIALLFVTKVVASGAIHLIFLFILYPHKMSITRRNTTRKHFYPSQTRNLNFMGPSLPHWSEGQSA